MHIRQDISIRKVAADAEQYYRDGFYCCEAVVAAIWDNFELDVPKEVIALASGMAVGVGRTGCLCGAVNGGVLALGLFFGRTEPGGPQDPKAVKCLALANELHSWFREHNGKGTTCCRVLTREFDMGQGEHKAQCIRFTGLCAGKTAEIIVRELGLTRLDPEN